MNALRQLLESARASRKAVGSFTCYNLEAAQAVAAAAEQLEAPAIILLASAAFRRPEGRRLGAALVAAGRQASSTVLVELDHEADLHVVHQARVVGVEAAMVDGCRLEVAANSALVADARAALGPEVGIEAELGRIEGNEDLDLGSEPGNLTDPDQVAEYVDRSGCDCLAVSIGNVHGRYRRPPRLDFDRLREIVSVSRVPISLHGASGLPEEELQHAVACGITKVNFNTELRQELFRAIAESLPRRHHGFDVLGLSQDATEALRSVVGAKLVLLGWGTR